MVFNSFTLYLQTDKNQKIINEKADNFEVSTYKKLGLGVWYPIELGSVDLNFWHYAHKYYLSFTNFWIKFDSVYSEFISVLFITKV